MANCKKCGLEFIKNTSRQLFCSIKCGMDFRNKLRVPKNYQKIKNCKICNCEFKDTTNNQCQFLCSNKSCKLAEARFRYKKYYLNPIYKSKAKFCSQRYRLNNRERVLGKMIIWRILNKDKISICSKKKRYYTGFSSSTEYNKNWYRKNIKYNILNYKLKWKLKTTIPIQLLRENYDYIKNISGVKIKNGNKKI